MHTFKVREGDLIHVRSASVAQQSVTFARVERYGPGVAQVTTVASGAETALIAPYDGQIEIAHPDVVVARVVKSEHMAYCRAWLSDQFNRERWTFKRILRNDTATLLFRRRLKSAPRTMSLFCGWGLVILQDNPMGVLACLNSNTSPHTTKLEFYQTSLPDAPNLRECFLADLAADRGGDYEKLAKDLL